jgi:hypothetical protein
MPFSTIKLTVRKYFPLLMVICFTTSFLPSPAEAQAELPASGEPDAGAVVCPPGIYPTAPDDCLPLGPSAYMTRMAAMGINLPLTPLPIYAPDTSLNDVPYHYFQVDEASGTSIYNSLADAQGKSGGNGQILLPGFVYVSYTERVDTGHGIYYFLDSGGWIPGDGARRSPLFFQGVVVAATPRDAFGWVLEDVDVKQFPSFNYSIPTVGKLHRFNMVQIFSVQNIEGNEWYLIGPDQWVEGRKVAGVFPSTAPPDGVTNGRWVDVNLAEQTIAVYDQGQMVFATLASTGIEPFWTRPGLFHIYEKKEKETMSGAFEANKADYYYLEDVPWTMYFDEARALHGSYWHTLFGYAHSHGCVNLSIGDAHWLFSWAKDGDWVWVHDPSGRTPTDPKFYTQGGA